MGEVVVMGRCGLIFTLVLVLAMEAKQARGLVKNRLFGVLGLFCTRYLDKRNCMKQCPAKNFIGNCESRYYFFGIPLGTKNCPCSKFGTPTPRNTTDDSEFTDGLETRRVGRQD